MSYVSSSSYSFNKGKSFEGSSGISFKRWEEMNNTEKVSKVFGLAPTYLIWYPIKYSYIGVGKLCKYSFKLLVNDYTAKAANFIFCKVIWNGLLAPIGRRIGQVASSAWKGTECVGRNLNEWVIQPIYKHVLCNIGKAIRFVATKAFKAIAFCFRKLWEGTAWVGRTLNNWIIQPIYGHILAPVGHLIRWIGTNVLAPSLKFVWRWTAVPLYDHVLSHIPGIIGDICSGCCNGCCQCCAGDDAEDDLGGLPKISPIVMLECQAELKQEANGEENKIVKTTSEGAQGYCWYNSEDQSINFQPVSDYDSKTFKNRVVVFLDERGVIHRLCINGTPATSCKLENPVAEIILKSMASETRLPIGASRGFLPTPPSRDVGDGSEL